MCVKDVERQNFICLLYRFHALIDDSLSSTQNAADVLPMLIYELA